MRALKIESETHDKNQAQSSHDALELQMESLCIEPYLDNIASNEPFQNYDEEWQENKPEGTSSDNCSRNLVVSDDTTRAKMPRDKNYN